MTGPSGSSLPATIPSGTGGAALVGGATGLGACSSDDLEGPDRRPRPGRRASTSTSRSAGRTRRGDGVAPRG
jgi:hypothetical protein